MNLNFLFLILKKIEFLEGGIESGFHHVEADKYQSRLLHLKGRKNVVVREVPLKIESLNSANAFILDAGLEIFHMNGRDCGPLEKAKAAEVTHALARERNGRARVWVFDETDEHDANANRFWELLGGRKPIALTPTEASDKVKTEKKLFQLGINKGQVEMVQCKEVSLKTLETNDVFIFDAGFEIFVWVGKKAPKEEKAKALGYASDYLFKNNRPKTLPICRILETAETDLFVEAFND